jgi:hypothetical protein
MASNDKKLDIKKILIFVVPLVVALLIVVFIKKSGEGENNSTDNQYAALIPDSDQDETVTDKVVAYKKEEDEERKRNRLKQESILRNSDFFKEVSGDKEEPIHNENVEDFYERTIVDKINKKEKQQVYKVEQPKRVDPSFYEVEPPAEPAIVKLNEVNKLDNTTGKKPSLQDRLNSHGKNKNTLNVTEELENDPTNYNRKRRRDNSIEETTNTFIKACVHEDQVATDGSSVAMRTLEECIISGVVIPRNTIFHGTANISEERMNIKVTNIKYGSQILKVSLVIYDNDAIKGLNLPDNIKKELAKRAKDSAADQIDVGTGGTGIVGNTVKSLSNVAKSVIKKDNAQTKVPLKANYQLFIIQNSK